MNPHLPNPPSTLRRPPPPPPQKPTAAPFRPTIAVIVVALATMFSLSLLLLLYAKHCRRQAASASTAAAAGASERRNSGVQRAVVESFPVFRFGSLVGEKEGLECAVCLGGFEREELLRLLPKCRHAFHVDCVDAWLDSHSTCPLCRSRVRPEDALLLRRPEAAEAPPARRVSGRHSSAGEKVSGCEVVGERRKDGMLMGEGEGGCGHRVVFCGAGMQERWSDLRPSDLMFLRGENEERRMRRWMGFAGKRTGGSNC